MGLDIGTSTLKLIFSRLHLDDRSGRGSLPQVAIAERELLYSSALHATPLIDEQEIDIERIRLILEKEYEQAHMRLDDIKAGAVIITGETATKRNAQQVLHYLAERAGDFVVATAGPDLEGILAGKGSGAEARSLQIKGVVANVDIGGGTANVAYFKEGRTLGTLTFHVGGRLIRLNPSGELQYVSKAIQPWLDANGFALASGMKITYTDLAEVAHRMGESLISYLMGGCRHHAELLHLGEVHGIYLQPTHLMVSGGIGSLMEEREPKSLGVVATYGDFGPLLAHALRRVCQQGRIHVIRAEDAGRATVMGAGMQSTEISGSTIYAPPSLLPLRNVPVLCVEFEDAAWSRLDETVTRGRNLTDEQDDSPFALALLGLPYCSYSDLQKLADHLASLFRSLLQHKSCMVILCERDMAKALGQALTLRCREHPPILCIDQVQISAGGQLDYIDIGSPLAGEAVPITVKTLAF